MRAGGERDLGIDFVSPLVLLGGDLGLATLLSFAVSRSGVRDLDWLLESDRERLL